MKVLIKLLHYILIVIAARTGCSCSCCTYSNNVAATADAIACMTCIGAQGPDSFKCGDVAPLALRVCNPVAALTALPAAVSAGSAGASGVHSEILARCPVPKLPMMIQALTSCALEA
jgi:hypothetical protein